MNIGIYTLYCTCVGDEMRMRSKYRITNESNQERCRTSLNAISRRPRKCKVPVIIVRTRSWKLLQHMYCAVWKFGVLRNIYEFTSMYVVYMNYVCVLFYFHETFGVPNSCTILIDNSKYIGKPIMTNYVIWSYVFLKLLYLWMKSLTEV